MTQSPLIHSFNSNVSVMPDVWHYITDKDVLRASATTSVARHMSNQLNIGVGVVCISKEVGISGLWQYLDLWEVAVYLDSVSDVEFLCDHTLQSRRALRRFSAASSRAFKWAADNAWTEPLSLHDAVVSFAKLHFSGNEVEHRTLSSSAYAKTIDAHVYLCYESEGSYSFGPDDEPSCARLSLELDDEDSLDVEQALYAASPEYPEMSLYVVIDPDNGGEIGGEMRVASGSRLQAAIMSGAPLPVFLVAQKGKDPSDTGLSFTQRLQRARAS